MTKQTEEMCGKTGTKLAPKIIPTLVCSARKAASIVNTAFSLPKSLPQRQIRDSDRVEF